MSADNYGYPVSGQYRFGFGAQLTNLFSFGDVISAGGSVAKTADDYVKAAVRLIGDGDTRVALAGS